MTSPVSKATEFSRYARSVLQRNPAWAAELETELRDPVRLAKMEAYLTQQRELEFGKRIRQLRQRVLLGLMARDLAGLAPLEEVTAGVTSLAELAVHRGCEHIRHQLHESYGDPIGEESDTTQELIVIGMGKLGSGELNVSSDIDLIFLYAEDGETNGPKRISNHEYFTLFGRKLIQLISEATEDGFVFRVDMRLRPYGDSGPLAMSFAMLENYLITQGRTWERFAWMKARALTGKKEDLDDLNELIRPFVFRKYLDYGAYAGIRDLHSQIRREVIRKHRSENIKLGSGGIREIEFIAQIFQLIRGGRDVRLQVKGTQEALRLLVDAELLPGEAVDELLSAYDFLRRLEHRLQYIDDQQTQTLPTNTDDLESIARSLNFDSVDVFLAHLGEHRRKVSHHFEQVFDEPEENGDQALSALWNGTAEDGPHQLEQLGYREGAALYALLHEFRQGPKVRQLPSGNRQRLDQLMPRLIDVAAKESKPDATLRRLVRLMEAISRRESYLALLTEHPQTLERVSALYNASPWVSDFLTLHPLLLDELLDTRILYKEPDWPELARQLHHQLDRLNGDVENQMNFMREFHHAQVFRLVASDLAGLLTLERVSDHLAALADLVLEETLYRCWLDIRTRHRDKPCFAIIGYGKLGAKEIGYGSDLDLIFLYDDDHENASENYAKLAKKISNWLTTLTRAGILYDVDLRLRPNGASGLLVSSTDAFHHYQTKEAWVWEHQALTRARFSAGNRDIGETFDRIRAAVLGQRRETTSLKHEVLEMRRKMFDNHKPIAGFFDVKQDKGGLIDLEFTVQYLILKEAANHPPLLDNVGNIALLGRFAQIDLIPGPLSQAAANAYRQLRQAQHALRLEGSDHSRVPETKLQAEREAIMQLWNAVFDGSSREDRV